MTEKVLQFGEGNFLRGFVDYFIHIMNEKCGFDGSVIVVQPIKEGKIDILNSQNGIYNLFLRGTDTSGEKIEHTEVHSISRGIDVYKDYEKFLEVASVESLRFIISNTTEAGIEYIGDEPFSPDTPPKSYPAKLTMFLYERFRRNLPGFIIFPCELIDSNADMLFDCVNRYARLWSLGDDFIKWISDENYFCNTLVDRIITGYPGDEADELTEKYIGYEDKLIDTGELFHLWVIEGNFEDEFPLESAGINVIWTDDITPYKKRKVRILNGAHTSLVAISMLCGLETVREAVTDEITGQFLNKCLYGEIIPSLAETVEFAEEFAASTVNRFKNPYIRHRLDAIALNSISKFKVRVLPSILDYYQLNGAVPEALTFSFAAMIALYKNGFSSDVPETAAFIQSASIEEILNSKDIWNVDLSFLNNSLQKYYRDITSNGAYEAIKHII